MNESTTIAPTGNSKKMLFAMAGIGTLCALLIVLTYEGTLPRINHLKSEALEQAIFKVLPGISQTQAFTLDANDELVLATGKDQTAMLYAGYDENGQLKGVAIEATGQGYADKIKILYGYDPFKEAVVGFYVLETKETPGLGDKIEKDPDFLANFESLDVSINETKEGLANPVVTVKSGEKSQPWQIDGITGATISSRAIGDIINKSAGKWAPLIQRQLEALMLNPETESS